MTSKWQGLIAVAAVAAVVAGIALSKSGPSTTGGTSATAAVGMPKMLEVGSTTCIPCKAMMAVVEELKTDYKGRLAVQFIDIHADTNAVAKYKIDKIPTQILYDAKGKEIFRHMGFFPKAEIVKAFKANGVDLETQKKAEGK